jgi:hypothetical protein
MAQWAGKSAWNHFLTARSTATSRPSSDEATSDDYQRAVFDDLARRPSR